MLRLSLAILGLAPTASLLAEPEIAYSSAVLPAGTLPASIAESSGLARSLRAPGVYWTHNDKGNPPQLFALAEDGALRGTVRIEGAPNTDWEDLASFEHDGRAWLVIADVGDNQSKRQDCRLLFVPEPSPDALSPDKEITASVSYAFPVRFPDGPRDCEAVAIDAPAGAIYLVSKRTHPAAVYRLPLFPKDPANYPPAERVATLDLLETAIPGKPWTLPTSLDISADGRTAALLTYDQLMLYRRAADSTWTEAFAHAPAVVVRISIDTPAGPSWTSAEAVALTPAGDAALITNEGKSAPVQKILITLP